MGYIKKMTEPSKINSFQKHLEMKVVSRKNQENCSTLLLVTGSIEALQVMSEWDWAQRRR